MAQKSPEFDELIDRLMQEWHVPGLAIAVVDGEDVWTKGFGYANLEMETPATEETLFDIASSSKSFCSTALAYLVDSPTFPDVKWKTPVSKLMPEDFVLVDQYATENVTIEDILSHRTGLPRHDCSYHNLVMSKGRVGDDAQSVTRSMRNLALNKGLREEHQYCNIMFTAASHLVETLTGKKYAEVLKEKIWQPLCMDATFHDINAVHAASAERNLAQGYRWDEKNSSSERTEEGRSEGRCIPVPSYEQPEGQGAGCVFSSVSSFAKYLKAVVHRQLPGLSVKQHEELITPRSICLDSDNIPYHSQSLYALGWYVESYRGHACIGHGGDAYGFKSFVRYVPGKRWGLVMHANASQAFEFVETIWGYLVDRLLDITEIERVDWVTFWREKAENEEKEEREAGIPDPWKHVTEEQRAEESEWNIPLSGLAGTYYNSGYKALVLEIKDGELISDCSDRTFPFAMKFKHACGSKFVGQTSDLHGGFTNSLKVEFKIGEDGMAEKVGVGFEEGGEGGLIWFGRVH